MQVVKELVVNPGGNGLSRSEVQQVQCSSTKNESLLRNCIIKR